MKELIKKLTFLAILLVPFSAPCLFSQNITGIWRGNFFTEDGNTYKFELQVKQKSTGVTGVSYSYLNTTFYGKAIVTGSYNKIGKTALIREIKTTELRISGMSNACIMKCIFEYSKSGKEEFLEGTYTSVIEKDGYGAMKGDDCGGGKVFLRKVVTSDFYVEPFLRKTNTPAPPVKKVPTTPPVVKNPPVTKNPVTKNPVTKPPVNKNPVVKNSPTQTPTKIPVDTIATVRQTPVEKKNPIDNIPTPQVLRTRTNELVKTLTVHDETVIVKIYDNGEIDDDTISVYLDKKLVLSNQRLTTAPLTLKIKMDENITEHELVMVAENLGRIPPNTSLMIVESGDQRFEVRITSTEQKNAVVRFRYQPKNE